MRAQARVAEQFKEMVLNLDRCPHGRHFGDTCAGWRGPGLFEGGCRGGTSLGNPLLPPGTVLGNAWRHNGHYQVPAHTDDHNKPEAWIVAGTGVAELIPPPIIPRMVTVPDEIGMERAEKAVITCQNLGILAEHTAGILLLPELLPEQVAARVMCPRCNSLPIGHEGDCEP